MQVVYCIYPGNSQPLDRKDETVTNASETKMLNTMFLQPLIFFMSGPHTSTTLQCPIDWTGVNSLPFVSLGTLRSNDATANKNVSKNEFALFHSLSQFSLPTYFVKCRRTFLELNSQGPYPSSKRDIKVRCCLFMSAIKQEIRHFHVVVVQKQAKKFTKKRDACAKLLFCLENLLFF